MNRHSIVIIIMMLIIITVAFSFAVGYMFGFDDAYFRTAQACMQNCHCSIGRSMI